MSLSFGKCLTKNSITISAILHITKSNIIGKREGRERGKVWATERERYRGEGREGLGGREEGRSQMGRM